MSSRPQRLGRAEQIEEFADAPFPTDLIPPW
jgi:hypothetical protein